MRVASTDGSAISARLDVDGLPRGAGALGELLAGLGPRRAGAVGDLRGVAADLASGFLRLRALVARLRFGLLGVLLQPARGVLTRGGAGDGERRRRRKG